MDYVALPLVLEDDFTFDGGGPRSWREEASSESILFTRSVRTGVGR